MTDFINSLSDGMFFIGIPIAIFFTGVFMIAVLETVTKYACKKFQAARNHSTYYRGYAMRYFAWKTRGKKGRR